MGFKVLVDSREKNSWELNSSRVSATEKIKLDTGDYTIDGYEDILCIERKESVTELAGNITQARFKKELERIKEIPYAYLILEANIKEVLEYPYYEHGKHDICCYTCENVDCSIKGKKRYAFFDEMSANFQCKECEEPENICMVFRRRSNLHPNILQKIKLNGSFILRCLNRMQVKYDFNIIYADNREIAQRVAVNLMQDVLEWHKPKN